VSALVRDGAEQFRVSFAALAQKVAKDVVKQQPRGAAVQVDPYLIARAVAEVMAACTFRSAKGKRLLWNEYRVILARADFALVHALQGPLERDLGEALASEATASGAELVGELRVSVVYDEADELRAGEAVVRVGFVTTAQLPAVEAGELTVRFDAGQLGGLMKAVGSVETVIVQDPGAAPRAYRLRWPHGEAALALGATFVVGRPHPGAPPGFISLTGAGAKINKQQLWLAPVASGGVRIGRLAAANPVHVGGEALGPGEERTVTAPAEIALSRGELVLTLVPA
jgi:Protein of unknown function (DUF3662)